MKKETIFLLLGIFLLPAKMVLLYLIAEDGTALSGDHGAMPLVIGPAVSGGMNPRFDREALRGELVYGMADGTAKLVEIAPDGTALTEEGEPLFKTGPGSIFGDEIPVVKMPLKK